MQKVTQVQMAHSKSKIMHIYDIYKIMLLLHKNYAYTCEKALIRGGLKRWRDTGTIVPRLQEYMVNDYSRFAEATSQAESIISYSQRCLLWPLYFFLLSGKFPTW